MNQKNAAILRDKLNGTRVASTGQSQAPTEVDSFSIVAARRAIRNLQFVVDALIGDSIENDATDPSSTDQVWYRVVLLENRSVSNDRTVGFILLMSVVSGAITTGSFAVGLLYLASKVFA